MKRHPALEPFSRDHNDALSLARSLRQEKPEAPDAFLAAWEVEMLDHFDEEERLLSPLLTRELAHRLQTEHTDIKRLKEGLPATMPELGLALEQHVRWEERELFPWVEDNADAAQLEKLRESTDQLEERRWEHSPIRKANILKRRNAAM